MPLPSRRALEAPFTRPLRPPPVQQGIITTGPGKVVTAAFAGLKLALRFPRSRQVLGKVLPIFGFGGVVAGGLAVEKAITTGISAFRPKGVSMTMAPGPQIIGQVVTQGPFPIQFIRVWQAGFATFAMDTEGRRWVFRTKLGIWKRVRVRRNIVISGKDIDRARRLIRTTNRLTKMVKTLKKV